MPLAAPAGSMDPGILLGFAATGCVWAMGMVLEWSGRRRARSEAADTLAAIDSLPWEEVPSEPSLEVREPARAA